MRRDSDPFTVASSDGAAVRVDEMQYRVGDGPCMETLRTGQVVEVRDQAADTRWGPYSNRAAEQGVRSSLSLPLFVTDSTAGALNIYNFGKTNAFNGRRRQYAEIFAAQASRALTLMLRQAEQIAVSEQLEQALTSRTVIDQAIGVLMGQQRCTADEAFSLLRRHSQNTNRKLRDVAADVVSRVGGDPGAPPRGFQRATRRSATAN